MIKPLDYTILVERLQKLDMAVLAKELPALLQRGLSVERYGDIPRWQRSLEALPDLQVNRINLGERVGFTSTAAACDKDQAELEAALKGLHPWRKGPFQFDSVFIDTEWRSDLKWNRLVNFIDPLHGKTVLDVGCGSGYHCWRMREAGADLVLGVDPTPLFIMQYWAMQKYLQDRHVWVIPARLESLPPKQPFFDTVFSMGVLYHRRSPFDHLQELRDCLKPGGELVLETLVVEGKQGEVLVPEGRYSMMGNVWFIPSVPTLCGWLKKMKFFDINVIDVSVTTAEEQRSTAWMTFHSLSDFLDPTDREKTVEGYPAPRRALIKAKV